MPTTGKLRASFSAAGEQFQTTQETECFLESRRFKGGKSEKNKNHFFFKKVFLFSYAPARSFAGVWGESKPPTAFGTFGVQKYVLFLFLKTLRKLKRAVYPRAILSVKMAKTVGGFRFPPIPLKRPRGGGIINRKLVIPPLCEELPFPHLLRLLRYRNALCTQHSGISKLSHLQRKLM